MKTIFVIILSYFLMSCSSSDCIYNENREVYNENIKLSASIKCQNKIFDFGNVIIDPYKITINDECNDEVKFQLWHPAGKINNNIIFLIPGIGESNFKLMYPIAFNLIKNNFTVCFIGLRDIPGSLNEKLKRSEKCNEIFDIENFITFYKKNYSLKKINIGIYGISLGSIIGFNFINSTNENVKVFVSEGLPYDLSKTYRRLDSLNMASFDFLGLYNKYSLNNIQLKKNRYTKVLSLWGINDKLISKNEKEEAINKIDSFYTYFDYKIFSLNKHTFRNIFFNKEYKIINNKISNFLIQNIK